MPNLLSINFFVPELVLSATVLILLVGSLFKGFNKGLVSSYLAMAGLLIAFIFSLFQYNVGTPPIFWGMIVVDEPLIFFKAIFSITAVLIIIFSQRSKELFPILTKEGKGDAPEYYALIVGSVLGMNLLAGANNLLMIYLALEFVSLLSYVLVGYVKDSPRSGEAALKYVLYGAVASGVFLFGASLYYGATGSLYLSGFSSLAHLPSSIISLAGILMLAGFFYKIAAVPMQAWCPDVYEGAPIPITAFLSVAPKAAGFAILMRVSSEQGLTFGWPLIIVAVSALTMTFGNLAAIPQNNIKRLLAYSSIAHAGYLLMGVACATSKGFQAVYFYFIAYLVMNLGAFLVVEIVSNKTGSEGMESFKGLGRRGGYGTILGIVMTIFLLSLTGVPPFVGFVGKFYIFSAVVEAKLYWLAIVGIVNSVISLYYYMRVVKTMFFDESTDQAPFTVDAARLGTLAIFLAVLTIVLGLFWQPISTLVLSL